MPRQPEGKLVAKARTFIIGRGGRPFNIQGTEDSFQEVGIPDLLVCWRGMFIGLEFKQPGEEPSRKQAAVMQSIRNAGGVAKVIHSMAELRQLWSTLERRSPA